jgi:membrane protease subunit HflK
VVSPELEERKNQRGASSGIEKELDPGHRSLAEALRISFIILKIGIAIVVIWFLTSGIFVVGVNEAAVKLRFGRIVGTKADRVIGKGIHWAWPAPIDEIVRFPVEKPEVVRVSTFWFEPSVEEIKEGRQKRLGKDLETGYTITGDLNIVHSRWEIHYRISDPVKYLTGMYLESSRELEQRTKEILRRRDEFRRMTRPEREEVMARERLDVRTERAQKNVENFIRASLTNAAIKETARASVDEVLFGQQEAIKERVRERVTSYLAEADCGLSVTKVVLNEVKYPPEVADAFQDVQKADEEKQGRQNTARALATSILTKAAGRKAELIANAKTYKTQVVKSAEADAKYIERLLELSGTPDNPGDLALFLDRYYQQTVLEALESAEEIFVFPEVAQGQEEQLWVIVPRDPEQQRERILEAFK